jgi:FKBP-type peptidyl-prolyl cis-trans isomerase SlyD
MVVEVERSHFPEGIEIEVGMQFEAAYGQLVTVKSVTNDKITIDANHALAGQTLYFDVKVVSVRDATPEELSTGCGGGCGCDGDCDSGDCSTGGCGCGCGC